MSSRAFTIAVTIAAAGYLTAIAALFYYHITWRLRQRRRSPLRRGGSIFQERRR